MTEREALLRAICASPDDDTPRLVFADWLDEHEPESAWHAELIRLQCRGCGAAETLGAEKRWRKNPHNVLAMRDAFLVTESFRWGFVRPKRSEPRNCFAFVQRGFVSQIMMPAAEFVEKAGSIFSHNPIASTLR